jgi:coenzyme F420 hydrogenase subunit beta
MKKVQDIIKNDLCLGCGLCEAILGMEKCKMVISEKGFYLPEFLSPVSMKDNDLILNACPGIHIEGDNHKGIWGNIQSVTESWATDQVLRKKSATGGVISALAIYLLESHKVNAILQIGVKEGDWLHNQLLISRTRHDIFNNAQSRYAPALVFDKIIKILDASTDVFGFIGKPCDIAGIKNFISLYPQYEGRIKYTLAIFCAGIPSYNATKTLVAIAEKKDDPISLKYRGDGWPGEFVAKWDDGSSFKASYNDSWGKVLGRTLGLRCKVCPDGIGLLADISTGDSWNTKDGYPNFTEADGRNFCFIRTAKGTELYEGAVAEEYILSKDMAVDNIKTIHQYQYYRRIFSGWRIFAIQFSTKRLLKYNGVGLSNISFKINPLRGLREFAGTLKRYGKKNN